MEKVAIEIALRSVVSAMERMHVLGIDSDLHSGAVKTLKNVISAIDKAKKEKENDDHDEQRRNL